jgi:cytosine/adenosine deaminase-related metal-dependent hydrolase
MRLCNLYRLDKDISGDITVRDGLITDNDNAAGGLKLAFDQAIVFPGLINSHDHLDFNLFPQLGNQTYQNYVEWGEFIHREYKKQIADVLNIPIALRAEWGIFKNLLGGVTTVVNHGSPLSIKNPPITVFDKCQSIHSIHLEAKWHFKLNNPAKKNMPVAIHIGEGTDGPAHEEINRLIRWNIWRRKLIGIHGVAMTENQAVHFEALVWCPQSNQYLLNKTADVNRLKKHLPILFGTDSTLTGDWNIWEHLRTARDTALLTDSELWDSLTTNPARIWKLNSGSLNTGCDADLVVARLKNGKDKTESIYALNPTDILLVLSKGEIRLFDEVMYSQLTGVQFENFNKVKVGPGYKYVYGDIPCLMTSIRRYHADIQFPVSINPIDTNSFASLS